MKKLITLVLIVACTCSLAACGSKKEEKVDSKESTQIAGPEDLKGKEIGVQLGTTGDLYTTDEFGDENIERYNKGFEAVQALSQGKIDAVVIDDQPAKAFVAKTKGLKILEAAYAEEEYAMCFKKGNEDLVKKFDATIEELKKDGTFDQIISYYIGKEEGAVRYSSPADVNRSNGKLVMATNAEFEPYEYYDGEAIVGIDADFAQAIADKLGMELKIEDMAFDSIIPAVQGGKADFAAAGLTVSDERKTQVDFAQSYYTGRQVIIVKE
ncbi:MAG: transporter substrate-binding domain-containing protein [Lachnospiraceae bacterium]